MMRVLMVTEDIPAPQVGGLGKHVVTLANALIASGHNVTLMGRSDIAYDANKAEIGFIGRFIPGFDFIGAGWKEKQLGAWLPYKRVALARRIATAIMNQAPRFDVVHYHGHLPMVGGAVSHSVNFVQTRHDQGSECVTQLRFRNGAICETTDPLQCASCIHENPNVLRRFTSAAAVRQYRNKTRQAFESRKTIFVADFLRRQFLRSVPEARLDKTWVIHNFIDLQRLNRVASKGHDEQSRSLLLVGRMDYAKGFGVFLDALVRCNGHSLPVSIVGDGPAREDLQSKYKDSGVKFLGWRPYDEVVQLTRAAHACVVPSILEEPCSTTALEAIALGRPCLALNLGGMPELAQYQILPNQLRLATSIDNLANMAAQAFAEPFVQIPLLSSSSADIAVKVPEILKVYSA